MAASVPHSTESKPWGHTLQVSKYYSLLYYKTVLLYTVAANFAPEVQGDPWERADRPRPARGQTDRNLVSLYLYLENISVGQKQPTQFVFLLIILLYYILD